MRPDLVIFDCDVVLIDSELLAARADAACLAEAGIAMSPAEILERYLGLSAAAVAAGIESRYRCRLPSDFAARSQAHLMRLFEQQLQPVAHVEAMLDSLAAPFCVASSSTPERLAHALALTGLDQRFRAHIFSASLVARGKPAPDLFLHAAREMGITPRRCVVVEDSRAGV